uniref:Transmembrane protein 132C n=1 Tax=Suricata suricatta TaxID=37032 RepID=A0A673VRK9_SURSU
CDPAPHRAPRGWHGACLGLSPSPSAPPCLLSSRPPYLPVSYHILGAETSFFLQETTQDALPNASLHTRVESFFTYKARRPPLLNASYGPFSVQKVVPLDPTASASRLGPPGKSGLDLRLRAHILRDKVYLSRPKVQVLFHLLGRDWAAPGAAERLPCLRLFAFRETREVRAGCRLQGALGLCLLALPHASCHTPASRHLAEADLVPHERLRGGDAQGPLPTPQTRALPPSAVPAHPALPLRCPPPLPHWPPRRARDQEWVTAARWGVGTCANTGSLMLRLSLTRPHARRAKVKKGVNILGAQTSEPRQWDVRQEMGGGGKHTTTTVLCQRLAPGAPSFSSLSGTQPITWQVEYPRTATTDTAVSEIFVSQKDLVAIVPLATDTEILNTAILTGKTVALPVKVVSVEESGAVTDISELVECRSTDADVLKVSEGCDDVFVNGKEIKGKVDAVVNFTYQHLSALLHITVWVPRLPLQIEVSDTELSQIKGWRVPIVANSTPVGPEAPAREVERRGRGCALQYQHATVRVLTQFVAEGAGPWGQPSHLLGPDLQVDVTHLVADFMKLEEPRVATLRDNRVLVGREVGMATIQVLSPLSDSILAEKTVTVLDDKVSVTELAIQLVAGLSVTLHPSAEDSKTVTAVATAQELLRTPKQVGKFPEARGQKELGSCCA